MRVAAVQFKPVKGDVAASIARLVPLVEVAAEQGDLVVLPEMCTSGYLFPDRVAARRVAEPAEGRLLAALSPVARRRRAWVVAGFAEDDGGRLYNSALVVDPEGELRFVYRKTLLFEADAAWAEPGDSGYRAFDTPHGRFGVGICMDLNDDAFVDWATGADLVAIAFPTNWLEQGIAVWPYWADRLEGVSAALVAANTWGPEGALHFSGRSAVLRRRVVLAAAPLAGDAVIVTRLGDD